MSEQEIRDALEQVCDNLDRKARAEAKRRGRKLVYPLVLGAGLLVANCDDETETVNEPIGLYGVPSGSPTATQTGTGTTSGAAGRGGEGGNASGAATGGEGVGGEAGAAQADYMAPDL